MNSLFMLVLVMVHFPLVHYMPQHVVERVEIESPDTSPGSAIYRLYEFNLITQTLFALVSLVIQ